MGCRGLELDGHLYPLTQAQFLDGTLRHERREREAAVNGDAYMEPDGAEPRDSLWIDGLVSICAELPCQVLT